MSRSLPRFGASVVGFAGLSLSAAAQLVFLPPSALPTGPDASAAQVGDLDGDDVPDVVVMDWYSQSAPKMRVFLGLGDGSFTPVVLDVGLGAGFIRLADTNADGFLDLVASDTDIAPFFGVLPGDGAGGFLPYIGSDAGYFPGPFELARLDADDDLDAVVHTLGSPEELRVMMGDGAGGFVAQQSLTLKDPVMAQRNALAFGDFDENGWLDLATGDDAGVAIYRGLGDGWLDSTPLIVPSTAIIWRIVVADFNGDSHQDLALSVLDWHTGYASILVLRGHGDGSFAEPDLLPLGGWFSGIATADLDGDGDLDLLATQADDPHPNWVIAFVNAGDGTFMPGLKLSSAIDPAGTTSSTDPLLADLDADTRPDLVLSVPWFPSGSLLVALDRSYLPGSPFTDLGGALEGASGWPILVAEGNLAATAKSTLSLWNGLGGAPLFAVAGSTAVFAPFRGGTLVPAPNVVAVLGDTVADGPTELAFRAPPGVSGLSLVVQFWLADPAATQGFAATTGVRMQFP